ncbi:PAS domain S-box-containing protein [Singulisphaera sp. GP187]|uniref:ATP-binding protein n=1 Tax=Singulisphaera sp. GP187 TaxID=1882752 RepID=UPI000928CD1B|nr:ATP-binding protein [Singulisphaera sp. GP187]SIN87393.1 PAS domain S-box-containing protein [Singulisphaera sp. GP187]
MTGAHAERLGHPHHSFLGGGGKMGTLMRGFDWSSTTLGPVESWPQSLRSAVSICLNSCYPTAIYWGEDLTLLYNDAWSPIAGGKHPGALGRPAREVWAEIWDVIGPQFAHIYATGEGVFSTDQLLLMHRHGYTEECYFDYSFGPIRGEGGGIAGFFNSAAETTYRVLNERRTCLLKDLAAKTAFSRTGSEVCTQTLEVLASNTADIRFALLYLAPGTGDVAHLAGSMGLEPGDPSSPALISLNGTRPGEEVWPLATEVHSTSNENAVVVLDPPLGPREAAREALILPLSVAGQERMSGILVIGLSPRLALSDDYRRFLNLVAGHVSNAIASARTLEALSSARDRLEGILSAAEIGAWTVSFETGRASVDRNVAALFGVDERELADVGPDFFIERLHPDDREQVAAGLAHSRETGALYEAEFRIVKPDGSLRWAANRGRLRCDAAGRPLALDGVVLDITERKQAEHDVAAHLATETRRSNLLRQVAAASRSINASLSVESVARIVSEEARVIIGAHFSITHLTVGEDWNQAIQTVSQSNASNALSPDVEAFDGTALDALVRQTNQPIRLSQAELEAHPAWKKFGGPREDSPNATHGWLAVPLIGHGGRNLGLIRLSGKDEGEFTEEDEAVLTQLAAIAAVGIENARLYQALRETDHRKDEFLATLAHELRNPLAPIRTGLQILRLRREANQTDQTLDMMERQLGHMVHLIDDLMDVSRVSSGKITLRTERIELKTVVESAVETSRQLIEESGHELVIKLPAEPIVLEADRTRLGQVLANLLNNAAKYSEPGGRIELTTQRVGDEALIRVKDTGVGIPAEMLPKIFDMFTQVGASLERSQGGLGIGLTLVRRLVELHGGRIEARSKGSGHGSEFEIRLPAVGANPDAQQSVKSSLEREASEPAAKPRLLVVDDNQDSANTLARLLKLTGHEVRTAYDGNEALREADAFQPTLVLLDIGLPGMNGYEVAEELRRNQRLEGVTLIALTGWGQAEDRRRSREAGFDHHLVKPVDPDALQELMRSIAQAGN